MVATELIHMTEEIVTGFPEKFPLMFNVAVTDKAFEASFLIVSAIGVLAAIGLIYRNPIADYFVWFYAIGPGIVNGIAHFIFPVIAGTYYFPGLITVLMPFIVSIILIKRLVSGSREDRETLPRNAEGP